MVLVKNWPFFHRFFLSIIGQEIVFYDILERKDAFLGYKNNKFKKSKNWDFSKGVNPWFWSKIGHFSIVFFRHYRPGNCVLRYSRTKRTPFWAIKTTSSKSRKIENFPMVWVKNWPFFHRLFFREYRPGECVLRYS